jgi:uncharacterized protein YbcI
MKRNEIKIKQIESLLSQRIEDVYQQQLKHKIDAISYKLFDRALVILLEGTITSAEKLLKNNDNLQLAKQVRKALDNVIHPQIQNIIEEVLDVKVIDFLSDTTINSNLTGAIAIFEFKHKSKHEFKPKKN